MIFIDDKPINNFWTVGELSSITPFGHGHINNTYLVVAENGHFILQRINNKVFRTDALVSNYEVHVRAVIQYQYKYNCKFTPLILQTREKKYHFIDKAYFAWRLIEYVPDAKTYDISPDPKVSSQAAEALGKYQRFLNTINEASIQDSIKGFHNLSGRLKTFQMVIKLANSKLLLEANQEIKQLMALAQIAEQTSKLLPTVPTRVIHNDPKLNNILFAGNKVLVIDLDTIMSGKLMFDFGDMVRSFTSPAAEDDKDIDKTMLRTDHFTAIVKAYLSTLKNEILQSEKSSLLAGAKYIIYEQSIRFLIDFLQENKYYKISYPTHNLVRARTQIKLLQSLIDQESNLKRIVKLYG